MLKQGVIGFFLLATVSYGLSFSSVLAATETVFLKQLKVKDVILLPTRSSKYELTFTRPKTWNIHADSTINLTFQHSIALLPDRSWLKVIVNDNVIQHIPLTKENNEYASLSIPLPVGILKDFNKLTLEVEQHYTNRCEDPLDKALWTQVLPNTNIHFSYSPVVPKVTLAGYPYPIIDELTYSPAKVHYVIPQAVSEDELKALAYINAHLGQSAQKHELKTRVTQNTVVGADDEHLLFVGTPSKLTSLQGFASAFPGFRLQGNQWIDEKTGAALPGDTGLILFFQPPGTNRHTVLVVSGNSPSGVMRAASYLTTRPALSDIQGQATVVPSGWRVPDTRTAKVSKFVAYESKSFLELGFTNEEVHKITAQPIIYKVPVVTDFYGGLGNLWLDLSYSYSPKLNPEFSSLELRLNDVSVANIPLTNVDGESNRKATIPLASELIRPRNELVAQFHLMPDKQGWCVDNYIDHAWGKILDDSEFRVDGHPKSYLPDVGLLNSAMYPYSTADNLSTVQIIVPDAPTLDTVHAMLAFTTRLGRATLADTALRMQVNMGTKSPANGNHVAVFKHAGDDFPILSAAQLSWFGQGSSAGFLKQLALTGLPGSKATAKVLDSGAGTYIEQYSPSVDSVLTVFTASQPAGFEQLAQWFESDKHFETLASGFLQQDSAIDTVFNLLSEKAFHTEHPEAKQSQGWLGSLWSFLTGWLLKPFFWIASLPWLWIVGGIVLLLVGLMILRVVIGLFRR